MNCTLTTLKDALKREGITANEVETVKNGVVCRGYSISNGTGINPVIYYSSSETIEEFVSRVKEVLKRPQVSLDLTKLLSKSYILSNSYICFQKKSNEEIVKKNFLDGEQYIRISVNIDNCIGSIKLTQQILNSVDLSIHEIFKAAYLNSQKNANIIAMKDVLGIPNILLDEDLFYVCSYKENGKGAGLIAVTEVFEEFCIKNLIESIYIIPSSTEELLILPRTDSVDAEEFTNLVNEINESTVAPDLRLNATVYYYDLNTNVVKIAATFSKYDEEVVA